MEFSLKYLKYLLTAKTKYGIHSPFVYELLTKVINDSISHPVFDDIEVLRQQLLHSHEMIKVTDLGAGSRHGSTTERKVSDVAKRAVTSRKYCRLLFRLVKHFKPQNVLELGTSLGIGTLYLASASNQKQVVTFEGCPETARIAESNFSKMGKDDIQVVTGNFDETLATVVDSSERLDFVFFDGNHRKKPTLDYFQKCASKAGEGSLFIFDDIHWSAGMESAWEEIKRDKQVTVTVDLFFMGLVFFRKAQVKQDFVLRF